MTSAGGSSRSTDAKKDEVVRVRIHQPSDLPALSPVTCGILIQILTRIFSDSRKGSLDDDGTSDHKSVGHSR